MHLCARHHLRISSQHVNELVLEWLKPVLDIVLPPPDTPTTPRPEMGKAASILKCYFVSLKLSFLGLSICPACAISSNDTQVMRKTQNTMKVFERFNCTVNLKVKGFIQVFLCYFFDQKSVSANSYTFCNYGTQHHLNTSTDVFWLLFIKTNRI